MTAIRNCIRILFLILCLCIVFSFTESVQAQFRYTPVDYDGWQGFLNQSEKDALDGYILQNLSQPQALAFRLTVYEKTINPSIYRAVLIPNFAVYFASKLYLSLDFIELKVDKSAEKPEISPWQRKELPTTLSRTGLGLTQNAYRFPWNAGQTWVKVEGWHQTGFGGHGNKAVDFAPESLENIEVLAASSGYLATVCDYPGDFQTWLAITNEDGVSLYGHLDSQKINRSVLNMNVSQGTYLGDLYNPGKFVVFPSSKCGEGVGTHLHFALPHEWVSMFDAKSKLDLPAKTIGDNDVRFLVSDNSPCQGAPCLNPASVFNWQIQYFSDDSLGNTCGQQESFNQIFAIKNWGQEAPVAGCPQTDWGARMERKAYFSGGHYAFALNSTNWARIYVDGKLVLDHWGTLEKPLTKVSLSPGYHLLRLDFSVKSAEAQLAAWWSGPGYTVPQEVQNFTQWYAIFSPVDEP
ncbi:MAG: PA14 domain-containing protein [Anaerolineaceae bacterium]|nr:PA14 domain-containing protein [Anaerolineaceae bacterium]